MAKCANCDGQQWVCEDHPEVPWNGGDGCCGGAGSPCSCHPISKALNAQKIMDAQPVPENDRLIE